MFTIPCRYIRLRDKLTGRHRGKHTAHADFEKVRLFAVVLRPFLHLRLVRPLDRAAVDLVGYPPMLIPAEAFAESPDISRRVSKSKPNNLRVLVGQCTFGNLPNLIRNRRRLVKHQHNALALIVQTGERLRIMFRPRYKVSTPSLGIQPVFCRDTHHRIVKPIRRNTQPLPFTHFRRGFGAQLRLRVTRDNDLAIFAR